MVASCDEATAKALTLQQQNFNSVAATTSKAAQGNKMILAAMNHIQTLSTGLTGPSASEIAYETAQTNLYNSMNGENSLENTFKTYYKSENSDNLFGDKFKNVATTIANKYEAKFNEIVHTSELLNNVYKSSDTNVQNAKNLYNTLVQQNDDLVAVKNDTLNDFSTNDRKGYYEDQELNDLRWWYIACLILYLTLVVIYVIILFVTPSEMTRYKRVGIALLLGLYVFFADYIAHALIALWKYMMSLLPKNVYLSL